MRVLVSTLCNPDDRMTLATIRALAAEGAEVFVASDEFRGQAPASRFLKGRFRLPHPELDERAHVAGLLDAVRGGGFDVVLPTRLETTYPLARRRQDLAEHVRFAVPAASSLEATRNKLATLSLAAEEGIRVPATFCPSNAEDLQSAATELTYPAVVKPVAGRGALGLWFARSERELIRDWMVPRAGAREAPSWGGMLVQEYIPGAVHDACTLFRDGELRAWLTQRRLVMYPASGGAGVYNETTREPDVANAAARLLQRLSWHGPAQVEFKRDERTGELVLMEINGRLWGTLDLAIQAGMNFPWLWCTLADVGDVTFTTNYDAGLRYRWPIPFGLLHSLESPNPFRALWRFFGPARGTRSDLRWHDPLPHLAEIRYTVRRMRERKSLRPARDG